MREKVKSMHVCVLLMREREGERQRVRERQEETEKELERREQGEGMIERRQREGEDGAGKKAQGRPRETD